MQTSNPLFSDYAYNKLKFVAQILLPALGSLYFTIGELWHLAKTAEVVGTISAVDLFLGLILGVSTKMYQRGITRGEIVINEAEETAKLALDSADLQGKHSAKLNIRTVSPTS